MLYIVQGAQALVALGLLNVWLLRFSKQTAYRGGQAANMLEEFAVYGLPPWMCYLVGALKVGAGTCLLLGFIWPVLVAPAAALVGLLMLGAIAMHWKVRDPLSKSLPAICVLVLSVVVLAWGGVLKAG